MVNLELKDTEKKYIEFIIKDNDGNRFDLTGMVATIQVQKYGTTTLALEDACEITDYTNGEMRWLYTGTLATGNYKGEIEITTSTGFKYITPTIEIEIVSNLPE